MSAEEPGAPRPGTTASVEARVARLELQYDRLDGKVDDIGIRLERIASDQGHIAQLVTTQHQALTAELALVRSRYHDVANVVQRADQRSELTAKDVIEIRDAMRQGLTAVSDPSATPAGRQVLALLAASKEERERDHQAIRGEIKDVRDAAKAVAAETDKNRLWIVAATAIVSTALIVLNLFAPAIRAALGVPS